MAGLLAAAFAPPAFGLTGAVYTSNFDGSIINENTGYAAKTDVYLTGGPCNGGSHLADGDYYFEVTSPSGDLLSSDPIGDRLFTVANGFIQSTEEHATNPVNCSPPVTGITVQLFPFDDTPNPGGEYKLTIATAASVEECEGFDDESATFEICNGADSKSDNFKVGAAEQTPAPTPDPTPAPTPEPTPDPTPEPTPEPTPAPTPEPTPEPTPAPTDGTPGPTPEPTPVPTGGVGGATATPPAATTGTTLPPTDALGETSKSSSGDTWRFVLLALAGTLAGALLLTPARAVRKDR